MGRRELDEAHPLLPRQDLRGGREGGAQVPRGHRPALGQGDAPRAPGQARLLSPLESSRDKCCANLLRNFVMCPWFRPVAWTEIAGSVDPSISAYRAASGD